MTQTARPIRSAHSPERRQFSVLCWRGWCDNDFRDRDVAAMVGAVTGTECPVPTHLPKRACPTPATCECECHDDGRAEQVSRYRESMPAPTNKRNRWRVYGANDLFGDYTSQTAAYEAVAELTGFGHPAKVYHWESGSWRLYERIEAGDPAFADRDRTEQESGR